MGIHRVIWGSGVTRPSLALVTKVPIDPCISPLSMLFGSFFELNLHGYSDIELQTPSLNPKPYPPKS